MRALNIKDTLRSHAASARLWRWVVGLLLFVALLAALSAGFSSWARTTRQQTALVLTLVARQSLLIEQIAVNTEELRQDREDAAVHLASLEEAAGTFEETLWALAQGGQVPLATGQPLDVEPSEDAGVQGQLHQVHHTWDVLRGYLDTIAAEELGSPDLTRAIEAVARLSPQLRQELEALNRSYEEATLAEASRLRWIQSVLIFGTAGLVLLGFLATRTFVLKPMRMLGTAADQISRGDLETPVEVRGPREVEAMAQSLETMRIQLKSSQDRLIGRAARLESRADQHRDPFEAAYEFSQNALTGFDIDQLATAITRQVLQLVDAEGAKLSLVAVTGDRVIWAAEREPDTGLVRSAQPAGDRLVIQVVGHGEVGDPGEACTGCAARASDGTERCTYAPLRTGTKTFGTICVYRSNGRVFGQDEQRALTLLANAAAIAIANASLLEAERHYAEQIASLRERERLAADLHDDLAQTLSFLNLKVDKLRTLLAEEQGVEAGSELAKMQEGLDRAYAQVRASLVDLRRSDPKGEGPNAPIGSTAVLSEQLVDSLATFHDASGLYADLVIVDPGALDVSAEAQKQVVLIVREALANAWKHARAERVWLRVERNGDQDEACFIVEDNGSGFDPASVATDKHLGLTVMRARAERSGGRLAIDSRPGAGTRIIATFPLKAPAEEKVP